MQYGDVLGRLVQLAKFQMIASIRRSIAFWEPRELYTPNSDLDFDQQKSDALTMDRNAIIVIQSPLTTPSHSRSSVNDLFHRLDHSLASFVIAL